MFKELDINDKIKVEGYDVAWIGHVTSSSYQISKIKNIYDPKIEIDWITKHDYHSKNKFLNMAKVKVIKRSSKFEESDLEYPIYLYFQDEDCHDEYVKVDEKIAIIVKSTIYGYTIETNSHFLMEERYLKSITKKEYFDEFLDEALKYISEKR